MIDKEYEKETLDKLKKDLKDINTYTSFKNGTYFYDLGYFQGSILIDELERYKNIVDELEKYIETRLNILAIKIDNKAKDQYMNDKCIGGTQELKHITSLIEELKGSDE